MTTVHHTVIFGTLLVTLVILCMVTKDTSSPSMTETRTGNFASPDAPWRPPEQIDMVLTPEECASIIAKAEPNFSRSMVVGKTVEASDVRTSDTAWISRDDPLAKKVLVRAAELAGKPLEHCEDLQVVRYTKGAEYRPHHDSCCDPTDGCKEFAKRGQRVGTLLVYLNSDFTGGDTFFPNLNQGFKPAPGSGVFFRPMTNDETQCHPSALHAGRPVESGIKYVCNAWVRTVKF